MKKDLVTVFKEKVAEISEQSGFKYKILYKGYKDALENNRLHVYWHKPVKLAEVTTPEGKITFEVTGNFKAKLESPDGPITDITECLKPLTPFDTTTVDDVGLTHDGISIATDKDVEKYTDPDSEWRIVPSEETYVQASCEDKTHVFIDPSIVRAIFNLDVINELISDNKSEDVAITNEPVETVEETKETTEMAKPVEEPEEKPKKVVKKTTKKVEEVIEEVPKEEKPKKTVTKKVKSEEVTKEKKVTKNKEDKPMATIKDSGDRTEFESGAVRDRQAGKGRFDLVPIFIMSKFFEFNVEGTVLEEIAKFQETKDWTHLVLAAKAFSAEHFDCDETAMLEYACHMEDGCNKYGDRNWEKGIPLSRYIDSGIRHYMKCRRGDDDERHDRAFIWNMLCGAWTCINHPDLIEQ